MNDNIIELKNLNKSFGPVRALKDVSFDVRRGEVLALLGENGAGKSTVVKALTGFHQYDSGEVRINGRLENIKNPQYAEELGIRQIYQNINDVSQMTVAENIFLGKWIKKAGGFVDIKRMHKEAKELLDSLDVHIDTRELICDLSIASRQMVAIAKALKDDSSVLILDEPTAVLSENEANKLFAMIKMLSAKGVTIIYISHRLEEIFKICNRIVVMRDGMVVKTLITEETNRENLITHMLGKKLDDIFPKKPMPSEEVVLEAENISTKNIKNVSFKLHKGEILGIGGLVGSGRSELFMALYGVDKLVAGQIKLRGRAVALNTPKNAVDDGLLLMPEDRAKQAMVKAKSIRENATLSSLKKVSGKGFIKFGQERKIVKDNFDAVSVVAPSIETDVGDLSGGNQQKVVIMKAMIRNPEILLADEPTQGIDVGAKFEIYRLLAEIASTGVSVIFISSEISELIGVCNRVLVMRENKLVGELEGNEISEENILKNMYGGGNEEQ